MGPDFDRRPLRRKSHGIVDQFAERLPHKMGIAVDFEFPFQRTLQQFDVAGPGMGLVAGQRVIEDFADQDG